jgi:hypothetical protein
VRVFVQIIAQLHLNQPLPEARFRLWINGPCEILPVCFDSRMKIEEGVCSLELARRLRALGVKQRSVLYWVVPRSGESNLSSLEYADVRRSWLDGMLERVSAFTVADLGEMLPLKYELPVRGKNGKFGSPFLGRWESRLTPAPKCLATFWRVAWCNSGV